MFQTATLQLVNKSSEDWFTRAVGALTQVKMKKPNQTLHSLLRKLHKVRLGFFIFTWVKRIFQQT